MNKIDMLAKLNIIMSDYGIGMLLIGEGYVIYKESAAP